MAGLGFQGMPPIGLCFIASSETQSDLCQRTPAELVLRRPPVARVPTVPGEAQLALASLRASEMLGDDSNHRAALMDALAAPIAAVLAAPRADFESLWCGGKHPEIQRWFIPD